MIRFVLASALLVACSNRPSGSSDPSGNPDVVVTPPADPSGGAAIFARTRLEGDDVVVDVVTRGTPDLSGVALRIGFPKWLAFDHREPAGWSDQSVHHTKTSAASEVVLADVVTGKAVAHAAPAAGGEAVLTTLTFHRLKAPTDAELGAIRFVTSRSELRDAAGAKVEATFVDQAFAR